MLVFTATLTPLATWLLYTQVREMPPEPEEAALIDGCSRWKAFVRVVVPQMSSGIAAVAAITDAVGVGRVPDPAAADADR